MIACERLSIGDAVRQFQLAHACKLTFKAGGTFLNSSGREGATTAAVHRREVILRKLGLGLNRLEPLRKIHRRPGDLHSDKGVTISLRVVKLSESNTDTMLERGVGLQRFGERIHRLIKVSTGHLASWCTVDHQTLGRLGIGVSTTPKLGVVAINLQKLVNGGWGIVAMVLSTDEHV